jgi:hypothetical protein
MFEQASRLKIRFETSKGLLSVEDLWDLPLTSDTGRANLDDLARGLHQHLKDAGDNVSFVSPVENKADERLQLGFDVVKHIIGVRVAERDAAKAETDRKARKQRIMSIIAQKEDEKLSSTSLEELRAMLETV